MREPVWVPIEALIDLHAELIAEHGGVPGLRDRGLLESALARPKQIHSYGGASEFFDLAAAYPAGILRNHPFVDGNKRAALMALGLFLGLNGWYLDATEKEAERSILALADGSMTEPDVAAWLRARCDRASEEADSSSTPTAPFGQRGR